MRTSYSSVKTLQQIKRCIFSFYYSRSLFRTQMSASVSSVNASLNWKTLLPWRESAAGLVKISVGLLQWLRTLTRDQSLDQQGFVLLGVLQHPLEVLLLPLDGDLAAQLRFDSAGGRSSLRGWSRDGGGVSRCLLQTENSREQLQKLSCYLLTPGPSSCKSSAASSASSRSSPVSPPAPWGPTNRKTQTDMMNVTVRVSQLCVAAAAAHFLTRLSLVSRVISCWTLNSTWASGDRDMV